MFQFQRPSWILLFSLAVVSCKKSDSDPNAVAIHGISPAAGGKNTSVTITGVNFGATAADDQVFINEKPATITEASATSITVTVPPGAGTGYVVVRTGTQAAKGPVFSYTFNYYAVSTLAGSMDGFQDGNGADAKFGFINGLTCDKDGNVIVADFTHHAIRKVTPDGVVSTMAGTGVAGFADGPAQAAQFAHPYDVAADLVNNIYVADYDNNKIRELVYSPAGYKVITLAGDPFGGPGFVDAVGTHARFQLPTGLAIDTVGNLYVSEVGNYSLRRIHLQDTTVVTMAGNGTIGYQNHSGLEAKFAYPIKIDVNPRGNFGLIADQDNFIIRGIAPLLAASANNVTTEIGTYPGGEGYQDGDYTVVKFESPRDIAIDEPHDRVYIVDLDNNCVRMADTKMHKVTTLAGSPSRAGSADGPLETASFTNPSAIAVDKSGNIYIADNHRVRKIAFE